MRDSTCGMHPKIKIAFCNLLSWFLKIIIYLRMATNETDGDESREEEGDGVCQLKREHPLYKQIAAMSGTVNAMTDSKRREELKQLGLNHRYLSCRCVAISIAPFLLSF